MSRPNGNNGALQALNIGRVFGTRRKVTALSDVSLEIPHGHVQALLGPNGAGKTTTVRICSTLLTPSSGSVFIEGIDAIKYPEKARTKLGLVLGGDLGFYPRATAWDNLLFFADLQGVDYRKRKQVVLRSLEQVGLTQDARRKTNEFSRGMLQRLHLARAILPTRLFCCLTSLPRALIRMWRCGYGISYVNLLIKELLFY